MALSRRLRRWLSGALGAAILFTQLAVAAYVCPPSDAGHPVPAAMAGMPDCHDAEEGRPRPAATVQGALRQRGAILGSRCLARPAAQPRFGGPAAACDRACHRGALRDSACARHAADGPAGPAAPLPFAPRPSQLTPASPARPDGRARLFPGFDSEDFHAISFHGMGPGPGLRVRRAGPAIAQDAALGSNVQGLLEHARAQNPELASMRLEAEAAAQRVQPAGALPDPVLRVELMNVNNYGNDAGFNLLPSKVGETQVHADADAARLGQARPAPRRGQRRRAAGHGAHGRRPGPNWPCASRPATRATTWRRSNERLTREILDLMGARGADRAGALRRRAGGAAGRDPGAARADRHAVRTDHAGRRETAGARTPERPAGARRRRAAGRAGRLAARCRPSARWKRPRWRNGREPTIRSWPPKMRGCAAPRKAASSRAATATRM